MRLLQRLQPRRKILLQEEKVQKRICKNSIEEIIHDKLFIAKSSRNKYDINKFIADYGTTSYVVTKEENVSNLWNVKTITTVWDGGTITGKNVAIGIDTINVTKNYMTLSNTFIILVPNTNLFSVMQALQKGF